MPCVSCLSIEGCQIASLKLLLKLALTQARFTLISVLLMQPKLQLWQAILWSCGPLLQLLSGNQCLALDTLSVSDFFEAQLPCAM